MLIGGTTLSQADDGSQTKLSEVALFHRCYADITGLRPAKSHALLAQVTAGQLSAVNACMQVLDKAIFVPVAQSSLSAADKAKITPANTSASYMPHVVQNNADPETLAVLNHFNDFHRQFFTIQDFTQSPNGYLMRHHDPTEPALYLTRLLFQPNTPFSEVVTGNYSVRGIRSLGSWVRNFYTGGSTTRNLTIPGTALERGDLWGVSAYAAGNQAWMADDGSLFTDLNSFDFNHPPNTTFRTYRSFGGGVLGLQSYLVMNAGFDNITSEDNPNDATERSSGVSNASRRMMRRWSVNNFRDILCRQAPLLRTTDVSNLVSGYLQTVTDPSKQLPFRTSTGCMSCHAALDPMAATVRALFYKESLMPWATPSEVVNNFESTFRITFFTKNSLRADALTPVLLPAEAPANGEYSNMSRDSSFYRRPSTGDLRYRSYDGSLVWQHFAATGDSDGLQKMGQWIAANSNDLYVCAASKYLKFFTGIEVNLQDPGDPRLPAISAADAHYRDIAVDLGLKLKSSQSLRSLIRDILSSNLYQKRGMRDVAQ